MSSMRRRVAVVGGGLAGLAATLALAEQGCQVELFEGRRTLGGRAGSFVDPVSGERVDHCQHVGMGCCTNLRDFCRRAGIEPAFRRDRVLHFFGPDGRHYRLQGSPLLPAPLHLGPALLRQGYLTWRERLAVARSLLRLARLRPQVGEPERTVGQWLRDEGQSPAAVRRFWAVVLVSALGESLERASLSAARKVFVDGFLAARDAYPLFVPIEPLGQIFDQRLVVRLEQLRVTVHRETPVSRLSGDASGVKQLVVQGDVARRDFDAFVLAVPWRHAADLLSAELRAAVPGVASAATIDASPITALHLWLDRPIMSLPHAVLVDRLSQWVFRHGPSVQHDIDLPSEPAGPVGRETTAHYYQVVISASRELTGRQRQDVLREVLDDLAAIWPATRQAQVVRWRMVTQPEAVFSVRPGLDAVRPEQATVVANLALAGDWTRTGWPSTMEGAVRSGYRAAEFVLSGLGNKSVRLVVPDLPRGWLSRLLLGNT